MANLEAFQELIEKEEHVAVFCYRSYCQSCKPMAPVFEQVSKDVSFAGVIFVKVDLEEQKDISQKYDITISPTVVYFFRAREIIRFFGAKTKEKISAGLQDAISSEKSNERNASVAASPLPSDGPYCQGIYEDRKKTSALFSARRKFFNDLEPRCVIKPTAAEYETHTPIGRANQGDAHFAVYLWNKPTESPGKIFFGLDFINNGANKDRFKSAMFQVTFGYHDADKTHLPINIEDIFPSSAEQLVSHTEFDADLGIDLESDSVSTTSQDLAFISGQGRHSPTATWNFVEAIGGGLDAHYLVSVTLPTTSKIWMKLYGKAVHVRGGLTLGSGRAIIHVGSLEKPYERILDLSEVI
ncbi:hypothetical protein GALMADRAFT_1049939 [Galerina marginata CBS 339.88]|uniref:Thioredoxin domain-containing protein n=1 Tax=Galerina marginata (strain CBS 339.88) TaxID=685588 RepID=A0A067SBK4_GALM3|nr:hypothetical protein GALMADRAFT_1049939 [Galerina marginata CBS 339.88]